MVKAFVWNQLALTGHAFGSAVLDGCCSLRVVGSLNDQAVASLDGCESNDGWTCMDKNSQSQDLDLESVSIPDTIRNISPAKLQQTFALRNLTSYMKIVSVLEMTLVLWHWWWTIRYLLKYSLTVTWICLLSITTCWSSFSNSMAAYSYKRNHQINYFLAYKPKPGSKTVGRAQANAPYLMKLMLFLQTFCHSQWEMGKGQR